MHSTILTATAFTQAKYVPYYMKWVSYCYSYLDQPDNFILTSDQIQSYLNHISKIREDWQVQQAEAALKLYEYYISSELKTPKESVEPGPAPETKDRWTALEKTFRDALRLRHRSYSTEKTYLSWLRAFGAHVNWKTPSELSSADMQHFLSSLAIERRVSPSTQNQELNALIFAYRHVLEKQPGPEEIRAVRALPILEKGYAIRTIQELLGHENLQTTMIYTHVLRELQGVPQSPLDALMKEGR